MDTAVMVLTVIGLAVLAVLVAYVTQPRRGLRRALERLANESRDVVLTTSKHFHGFAAGGKPPMLVTGQAVITANPLVRRLTAIRRLFGGELGMISKISQWALYLAMQRMVREAKEAGYNAIGNIRIQTADLGPAFGRVNTILTEVVVYGTAYQVDGAERTG